VLLVVCVDVEFAGRLSVKAEDIVGNGGSSAICICHDARRPDTNRTIHLILEWKVFSGRNIAVKDEKTSHRARPSPRQFEALRVHANWVCAIAILVSSQPRFLTASTRLLRLHEDTV
jgi:hypothetical protein